MSAQLQESPTSSSWQAYLQLGFAERAAKTRLLPQKRYGPLAVQRPFYPEGDCCHTYLLHPPGGVVGGDSLHLQVLSETHSSALITTPGATKFYNSGARLAQLQQELQLEAGAALEWLPQENIYFPGAELQACTRIELQADSRFIGAEIHCLGRPANNESFDRGALQLDLQLYCGGRPLVLDRQRIDPVSRHSQAGLRSAAVQASMLLFGPSLSDTLLENLRGVGVSSGVVGITRLSPQLVIARYLGPHTHIAQQWLRSLWHIARPEVIGREPVAPRIWNT